MRSIRIQWQCRGRKNVIGRSLNRTEMIIETINTKVLVRWMVMSFVTLSFLKYFPYLIVYSNIVSYWKTSSILLLT